MKVREQLLLSEGVERILISDRGGSLNAALSLAEEHGVEAGMKQAVAVPRSTLLRCGEAADGV